MFSLEILQLTKIFYKIIDTLLLFELQFTVIRSYCNEIFL
jgi:hypothetical protein